MSVRQSKVTACIVCFALGTLAASLPARAHGLPDGDDVPTLFAIRKSANRNRVDYGLRLERGCAPVGDAPVFPYWRMLEIGRNAFEPLARRELRAYGVSSQRVTRGGEGARIDLRLRALRGKAITVAVGAAPSGCVASPTTTISGTRSVLEDVYVVLGGPVSIDYVELRGRAVSGGEATYERLDP